MIRTAAVMVLGMLVANQAHAAGRAEGTLRVVSFTLPEPGAQALTERMAALDADLAVLARHRGSVILSRHPITDLREVELSPAAPGEERCIAVVARVAMPGVPGGLYAVAAHLGSAAGTVKPADARQLSALVASLPGPVVLASDLEPVPGRPMTDVLSVAPGAAFRLADRAGVRADHLLTTPELPGQSAFVEAEARDGGNLAVVADLTLHPPLPVLPVRRAGLEREVVEN